MHDFGLPISLRPILIRLSHLCLGCPSSLLPSAFHSRIVSTFLFSPYMPYDLLISLSLIWLPITSYLTGPNIFVGTLFWNTLSLCCSSRVRDHVSYPYKTGGRIILLYVLILKRSVGWNWKETSVGIALRPPTRRLLSCGKWHCDIW
jgi:hypothetical protein